MKARIKKTGEIVNLASYAKITLECCDFWGNPIEVKPEEVELIGDVTEDEYWQDVRERAAIAALGGLLADSNVVAEEDKVAKAAVEYADALIKQLKKEQQ